MTLQDYYNTDDNSFISIAYWYAQVFEAGSNYDMTSVKLKLWKVSSLSEDVVLHIYNASAGYPSGSPLGSVSLAEANISTDSSGVWTEFVFDEAIPVSVSGKYAIVLESEQSQNLRWRLENPGFYTYGGTWYSDTGTTWYTRPYDFMFETYGTESKKKKK